ncbi:unnamed protein product [Lactuca saligna]|uniref:Uncharacterized protein n=1 Tax=Lactuca saligna TaxID=75948 RepID=A0AA35YCD9_LACSI|nr:unnamed protein product [Lactuca saligna]
MQDGLIELVIAYQVIHRLRDLFALYDRPQVEGSRFPSSILLGINLLVILSFRFGVVGSIDWESYMPENETQETKTSEWESKLLQDVPEDRPLDDLCKKEEKNTVVVVDGLVCLPSLLTAVLLQANSRLSSEQGSYVLPNDASKTRPIHLMSYLLSHCTTKWGAATDQTGLLLLESLLLLGYFAMFHPENQAVLWWGKSPTILHKVCDLPFVFFSDPELMPVLAGTLVAACFGSEQNKGVVQQELSIEMLLSLLKSCKNASQLNPLSSTTVPNESAESTQSGPETRKLHGDNTTSQRSNRMNTRSTRLQSGKTGSTLGNTNNNNRNQKDNNNNSSSNNNRVCESNYSESCSNLMLHSRFPTTFIDRAEFFFSTESPL